MAVDCEAAGHRIQKEMNVGILDGFLPSLLLRLI